MIEEFKFKSSTGKELYAKKWYDENLKNYKGVVQLVHGMEEFIGRYDEFALFLASKGYMVVGHDHIGHGNSVKDDRELGNFECKDAWFRLAEDIHILQNKVAKEYPNITYIVMGHSMGSLLTRTYLTIYNDNLSGAIITGTSGQKYGLHLGILLASIIKMFKGGDYKSKLLERLVTGSFNNNFKPTRTEADWTTSDETKVDEYMKVAKPNRKFTVDSYIALFKGSIYLNRKDKIKNTPNIPILIFSGDKDPVGANGKGVKRVYNMLKEAGVENITFKLFENGRHEMLNEVNRKEVFDFVSEWIENIQQ